MVGRVVVVTAIGAVTDAEPIVRVLKVRPTARVPSRASDGAAGLDLHADLTGSIVIARGQIVVVPTGIALALPAGHEGQVRPRSGLAAKHGITVLNAPGTIDEDFRGEVLVILVNHGAREYHLSAGDRVAQLVIAKIEKPRIVEVTTLEGTTRGEGGLGSTGR